MSTRRLGVSDVGALERAADRLVVGVTVEEPRQEDHLRRDVGDECAEVGCERVELLGQTAVAERQEARCARAEERGRASSLVLATPGHLAGVQIGADRPLAARGDGDLHDGTGVRQQGGDATAPRGLVIGVGGQHQHPPERRRGEDWTVAGQRAHRRQHRPRRRRDQRLDPRHGPHDRPGQSHDGPT
jgi:hypothetical protein